MTDLLDQGAAAIASAIRAGKASVRDVVPGISVPCGSGRDGLPVGRQIVTPCLHDRPVLAMAQRAEAALA